MKAKIYLDNNATTALVPEVINAILQDLRTQFGNPSSTHFFGQEARSRLIKARSVIASFLKVKPHEIIFTSGGTEAANMLIRGILEHSKGHVITSKLEHSCVYSTIKEMEARGCQATYISPGLVGAPTSEQVHHSLRPSTQLIALMAVNNETGVKTDIESIAAIAEEAQVPFVVDGVALLGKELFTIPQGVSAMFFSGHKLHAPKGIGFVFIRSHLKLSPLLIGGEQEFNRRGGTENLSGIIGLAEAISLLSTELPQASLKMKNLRDLLEKELIKNLPDVLINGQGSRIVNTSNLTFSGVDGELLLTCLDRTGIAVSHGSACSSGALEPSRVLLEMGIPMNLASSAIRFSLSRLTTEEEIYQTIEEVIRVVSRLRKK